MERAVEIFAAVTFLVIGLSHVAQPRAWVAFFVWLRSRGHAGVFANGFLSLNFGAFVVAFHDVWSWPAAVLTVIGWAQVAKALLSFVAPSVGLRSLERVAPERAWEFVAGGVIFLALSALLWYVVLTR